MGSGRLAVISRWRRGVGRAAVFLLGFALLIAGCGRKGHGAETDPAKAADVEYLNVLLTHELTAVEAYGQVLPRLRGQALRIGRQQLSQDQAHLDALTKAVRGVGGETDAEAEALEAAPPKTATAALLLAYEMENAALAEDLDAAPHMETAAPSTVVAALGASHAQHLVQLRQLLGTGLEAAVPEPFDNGEAPPPVPPAKTG